MVTLPAGTAQARDEEATLDYVSGDFAIQPGQWVPLDWTTDIEQDGTWMAVGNDGDVWIVTYPASDPQFTFLGYLPQQNIDAAQAQQSNAVTQDPTAPNVPVPAAPPPGAPQLPPPQVPGNPQADPLPFGALGGGPIIPDPNRIPAVYPLPGGIKFVVPGRGGLPPYYMIPIYPDGEIRLYPRANGNWAYGYVLPTWL